MSDPLTSILEKFTPRTLTSLSRQLTGDTSSDITQPKAADVAQLLRQAPAPDTAVDNTLQSERSEYLSQAHIAFILSIVLSAIGMVIIFVGVIGLLTTTMNVTTGALTTAGGIIPQILAAVAFNRSNKANEDLRRSMEDLHPLQTAMQINDPTKRDEVLAVIATRQKDAASDSKA